MGNSIADDGPQRRTQTETKSKGSKSDIKKEVEKHKELGKGLRTEGKNPDALFHFRKAINILKASLAPEHEISIIHYEIGETYLVMGRYEEAYDEFTSAYQLDKETVDNNEQMGVLLLGLGKASQKRGNYPEAVDWAKKSLALLECVHGKDSMELVKCLIELNSIHIKAGKYDDAAEYINMAIRIKKLHSQDQDVETAQIYSSLGLIKYDESLEYHKKSIEILKNIPGQESGVAGCLNNIGAVYSAKGDHENALNTLNEALEIKVKKFGENHSDVALLYHNKANLEQRLQRYNDSLTNNEKAIKIWCKVYRDENHPLIAGAYLDIGEMFLEQKRYDEARPNLEKAYEIRLVKLGESHPDTILAKSVLAKAETPEN